MNIGSNHCLRNVLAKIKERPKTMIKESTPKTRILKIDMLTDPKTEKSCFFLTTTKYFSLSLVANFSLKSTLARFR